MKEEMKDQSHRLREELKQLQRDAQHRNARHDIDISVLESNIEQAKKKLDVVLHKKRSFLALPMYLTLTRKAKKKTVAHHPMPPFLLAMEAEFLRHLHHMCILKAQLLLLHRQSEKCIRTAQRYLIKVTEERFKAEAQLLSDICYLERQRSDSEESLIQRLYDSEDELSLFQSNNESIRNEETECYKSTSTISSILTSIHTILSSSGTTAKPNTTRRSEVQKPKNAPHWKVPFAFSFERSKKTKAAKQMIKHNRKTSLDNIEATKYFIPERNNYSMATSCDALYHIVQL